MDGWAMNLPRYGHWKRSIKTDGLLLFFQCNIDEDNYFDALLQIESIIIKEVIPHIDGQYRTDATGENRMLSGFSMGGNMAFYYAVKHPELFGSVTSYAGTYHHLYHKGYRTVGVAPEKPWSYTKI